MKVGFVGLGNLGREVAEVMSDYYDVVGYDIRDDIVTSFRVTNTLRECVEGKDVVFVAVPTPHEEGYDGSESVSHLPYRDFNYSIVKEVVADVDRFLDSNTLLVLISTVLPGTIRREIAPLIKNARFIYNPYLIAQGTVKWDMVNPEMVIIGTKDGKASRDAIELIKFYMRIMENDPRYELGTWEEAEGIKIFYNTFITAKLVLVNSIQDVAHRVGNMNVDVITNALKKSTDRIMGPKYMRAGLGDGGGCHPRDNIALAHMSQRLKLPYNLYHDLMNIRELQSEMIAQYMIDLAKEYGLKDFVILGTGFKPGVDQKHGSPSILVGKILEDFEFEIDDLEVHYDEEPLKPAVYLIGWYDEFQSYPFYTGSVIVDPWRSFPKNEREDLKVFHYGNSRSE